MLIPALEVTCHLLLSQLLGADVLAVQSRAHISLGGEIRRSRDQEKPG